MNGFKSVAKTGVLNMSPVEVTFLTNPVCSKCCYIRINNDDCKHFYLHTKSNVNRKRVNIIFSYLKPVLCFRNYCTPLTFLKSLNMDTDRIIILYIVLCGHKIQLFIPWRRGDLGGGCLEWVLGSNLTEFD